MNQNITTEELVKLAAVDTEFYAKTFFPKAFRVPSSPSHRDAWKILESPHVRYANIRCYRGWSKTTRLRVFMSKRIAYGLSRTVLYIGASEGHAARSVNWLRNAVDRNKLYASTFGLRPGTKWQHTEAEIYREVDGEPTWVLGVGINGSVRGINFDDYRPDLIILDDVLTDESATTDVQRKKFSDLIMGAVMNSLISEVEEPNAKLCMLQTSIHPGDASDRATHSTMWSTVEYSCWTDETKDLPVEFQESSWPDMFPTETLRKRKIEAIRMNEYSTFAREMEGKLIPSELAAFRPEWLNQVEMIPDGYTVIAIDPVPPPSEVQIEKGLHNKDYEVIMAVRRNNGKYYVAEIQRNKGHDPDWTAKTAISMASRHRAAAILVEMVAYQRVLEWILKKEMQRLKVWHAILPAENDKRKKYNRIVSTLKGIAANGRLYCRPHHTSLISQWQEYPFCEHDDDLDCLSIALAHLVSPVLEIGEDEYMELDESSYPDLLVEYCP